VTKYGLVIGLIILFYIVLFVVGLDN